MIGIIEYGAGNVSSVKHALERIGAEVEIISDAAVAHRFAKLVLPGVGSYRKAMESLKKSGWCAEILSHIDNGKPFLGICLGMQVLFESGDEDGPTDGLGLIPGHVELIPSVHGLRVPHVGWNSLASISANPIVEGIKKGVDFYFVHSYRCVAADPLDVVAWCDYGGEFAAIVSRGPVVGVQFHPEKSQPMGLKILENFAYGDSVC